MCQKELPAPPKSARSRDPRAPVQVTDLGLPKQDWGAPSSCDSRPEATLVSRLTTREQERLIEREALAFLSIDQMKCFAGVGLPISL